MYADFFGFRELPFNNTPDPRFFYSTPDHEEALASLIYAVKEWKGFVLLTGDVGTGKTLVTRMMLRHFGTRIAFATINHALQTAGDLMESICTEFDLPTEPGASPTQLVRTLHDFLLAQFAQNTPVVLVLDEAQNLSVEGFEQLRMIGNLEADDAKLLQIVIVGQTELQRVFLSPALRQLRQRIFRSYHLPAMNREVSEGYIRHRLSVVTDTPTDIFSPEAVNAIYAYSRGLPRLINTVCDNVLLSAYSADRHTIDKVFVETVIEQMTTLGHPRETPDEGSQAQAALPPASAPSAPTPQAQIGEAAARGGETMQALRLASTLADRLNALEEHSRGRAPIAGAEEPPTCRQTTDHTSIINELATLRENIHRYVGKLGQRLSTLERRDQECQLDSSEARSAHASLKPLVQEARSIVGRAEAASRDLQRREEQLRKLSGTVRGVLRDLRSLLDRGRETAAKNSNTQRDAQMIHDRLAAQSERSRRLADELSRIVSRIVPTDTEGQGSTMLIKTVSAPAASVGSPIAGATVRPHGPVPMQSMLEGTRSSLSDLRDLARAPRGTGDTARTTRERPPTARLADEVENLLGMIESRVSANLQEENPPGDNTAVEADLAS